MATRFRKRLVKATEAGAALPKYRNNYTYGLRIDDVRDSRIAVVRTNFKRGESAKRYAEMVAFVQRNNGQATVGEVVDKTTYHMRDVSWDIRRGHIKIDDPPQVGLERALLREGELSQRIVQIRSRSSSVRDFCLEKHGVACVVCGTDFGKRYGDVFDGLVEVHHKNPMATSDGGRKTDPLADCCPLCPNCHRMAHYGMPSGTCRSLDDLKAIVSAGLQD